MNHIARQRIQLSPEYASLIDDAVASGEFSSPEAVVEEALNDWKERRTNFGYTVAELKASVQHGIDSGQSLDGPSAMERLRLKYQAMEG